MENKTKLGLLFSYDVCPEKRGLLYSGKFFFFILRWVFKWVSGNYVVGHIRRTYTEQRAWSHHLKRALSMVVMVYGKVIWAGYCLTVSEVESNLSYVTSLKRPRKKKVKESKQLNLTVFILSLKWIIVELPRQEKKKKASVVFSGNEAKIYFYFLLKVQCHFIMTVVCRHGIFF